MQDLLQKPSALRLEQRRLEDSEYEIVGDIPTGRFRPLVPRTYYEKIFNQLHSLSHGGAKATTKLMVERYVFFGAWSCPSGWCIGLRSWLRGFDAQLGYLHDACTSLPQKS